MGMGFIQNPAPADNNFNVVDLCRSEKTVRELLRLATKMNYYDDVKHWKALMAFKGWKDEPIATD